MKIPMIRQLYQSQTPRQLESALEFLENFGDFRGVTEKEHDVIGEMITGICGALEVHNQVKSGVPEKEALNNFAQKVMGSIDKH